MENGRSQPTAVAARLSAMMFLQFFIWGAWYVTPYLYLGKIGFFSSDIGWTYSVGPIAGMITPFILGMVADRFFATERILGVLHILGAGAMALAAYLMKQPYPDPKTINLVFFLYMLTYFPTLALTNSLALHNMTNAEKQFPLIRVFGTLGWIAAGGAISLLSWDDQLQMFYVAAGAAALMGVYSFTLPHTPPPAKGQSFSAREALGVDAFVLLKQPSFAVFMASSFLVCIPLAFYYQLTGRYVGQSGFENVAFTMSFGQMSEVIFMLAMPLFFARLGVKWMLCVGMLAWVIRYGLFALGADDGVAWMIIGGILLHGICYDFFFVTGQIYTDNVAPPKIRSQAQGMLVLFTLGLGMFIGAQICGQVEAMFTPDQAKTYLADAEELGKNYNTLRARLDGLSETEKTATVAEMDALATQINDLQGKAFAMKPNWKNIWMIPAIGAAVILVLFTLVFRDDTRKNGDQITEGDAAEAASTEPLM